MPDRTEQPWPDRVAAARAYLERRGHVDPVVAADTIDGTFSAGNPDQRWETGSITKLFTSVLLAEMAAAGLVKLDNPVTTFLPAGAPLARGVSEITLESLACHRSGLPRLPPGLSGNPFSRRSLADPYAAMDGDRLVASLATARVRGTPGEAPVRYSNYGAGLLGYLLGRAADGAGYENALTQRVLVPLGLLSSDFSDDDLHQGRYRGKPVGPWHLASLAGAGGLRSTANDLLVFLRALRDGSGPLAEPIAETLRPRQLGRLGGGVGLGWFLLGDGRLLMHDGGTLGARTEVRVERPTGTLVVVLGDGGRGTARAATMLLNPT